MARTRIHRISASRMMGFFAVLPCIMASGFLAQAQDEIGDNYVVTIPPPLVPLPESKQAPAPQSPGFNVIQTWSKSSYVAESPPMPGLPPVLGKIDVKTRKVEDPELPPMPESVVEAGKDATASARKDVATDDNYLGSELIFLSATVYDHKSTLLTLRVLGANSEVTAWSNLDFNHFTGASQFRVTSDTGKYIEYSLMMAIGNEDTEATAQIHSGLSEEALAAIRPVEIPELPALSLEGPAYMVVEGDADEAGRSDMLDYLHRMYAKEGYRLSQEYDQRMREYEQKKAYYLANPPKPKDVVLYYWRGKRSSEQSETP